MVFLTIARCITEAEGSVRSIRVTRTHTRYCDLEIKVMRTCRSSLQRTP